MSVSHCRETPVIVSHIGPATLVSHDEHPDTGDIVACRVRRTFPNGSVVMLTVDPDRIVMPLGSWWLEICARDEI